MRSKHLFIIGVNVAGCIASGILSHMLGVSYWVLWGLFFYGWLTGVIAQELE